MTLALLNSVGVFLCNSFGQFNYLYYLCTQSLKVLGSTAAIFYRLLRGGRDEETIEITYKTFNR